MVQLAQRIVDLILSTPSSLLMMLNDNSERMRNEGVVAVLFQPFTQFYQYGYTGTGQISLPGPIGSLPEIMSITGDLFINGLRLAFAGVFFGSFVIRRLVHRPLSRLGFAALTSGKPIFTMIFGGVSAAAELGSKVYKALV